MSEGKHMTEDADFVDLADIRTNTAAIASAYFQANAVDTDKVGGVVEDIMNALRGAKTKAEPESEKPVPAVPPRKSVFPDYIICLEDGKKLKLLKRHLKTAYNMTPQEYRERWGLPPEYPMVAPNYASHRSSLARRIGLGRQREDVKAAPAAASAPAKSK